MKFFDKFSLKIFSLIIFAITIIVGLAVVEILSVSEIVSYCEKIINEYFYIVIIVAVVLAIWSIRNIINGGKSSSENSSGILLENKNGKLLITKESINNLIETVVAENKDVSNVSTKLDFDKDVTADIQTKIKDSVKKATDLDIKEINIKIKNIEQLGGVQE